MPVTCSQNDKPTIIPHMTLILAALAPEYVVVGADRRLSDNGQSVEEESTKLTVLVTPDARTVIAYTGIARAGDFDTEHWILDTLSRVSSATPDLHSILEGLRSGAGMAVRQLAGTSPPDIRLTLLVAGFIYQRAAAEPLAWKITNWEHTGSGALTEEFQIISYAPSPHDNMLLISAGNTSAVEGSDTQVLEALLRRGIPAIGVEGKIHDIIRKASLSPLSRNTVGPQCNACIVSRDTALRIAATYYSEHVTRNVYSVNTVLHDMITSGALLQVGGSMPPAVVPKRGPNEPCSCGSEVKYQRCHGALEYLYLPMTVALSYLKPSYPSGQSIVVESRGAAGRSK